MKKLRIIYHSQSAHTESMARAVFSSVERIVKGYPLRKVAEPVLSVGELGEHSLERCAELGLSLAAGTAMGIF